MNTVRFRIHRLFALACLATIASAAQPRRAPRNVTSPEILPDHRVTFRLWAPRATEVVVNGQWHDGRGAMQKNERGLWTATMGPIEPGVWEYSFSVDGLRMIDPGNPAIKPMRQPRTSILHRPANPPALVDFQAVPHGVVHQHTYFSKPLDRPRELMVYTPPGYDGTATPAKRYPTLYLQHGMGDNQATWVVHGKAHWILDNLIAQSRARPMIVVMMDGHAITENGQAGFANNTAAFERDLLEQVMPFIEANYRVLSGPENRAIVGLSMGGGQSLTIGLNHLDRFAWVGGFSAATPAPEAVAKALEHPEQTRRQLKLLWIGVGRDDFLRQRNEAFVARLKAKGIPHEWVLTAGNHGWPIWRGYLSELAPKLFR